LSEERVRVDAKKLTDFSAKALEKLGVPEDDAVITARMLVACDLRGVESHGVAHLKMFYARRIRLGIINLNPKPQISSQAPSTAVMDGDNGPGFCCWLPCHEGGNEAGREDGGWVCCGAEQHPLWRRRLLCHDGTGT